MILNYPPIPNGNLFQKDYGYAEPVYVHKWQWSVTFGRWSALVMFNDGELTWTYPKEF